MQGYAILFAALLAGVSIATPAPSRAADAAALKSELAALKAEYDARIAALEARIAELEAQSAASAAPAAEPAPPAPVVAATTAPVAGGMSDAQTAFNPAMSAIIAGGYTDLSRDPDTFRIAGFVPGGGETGPGEGGFGVGESELTFSANVDPWFFANVTAAIESEDEIALEEAYFSTLALPAGLRLKAGRYLSAIGYLNEQHAHAWDFIDQPLVYQALFGGQLAHDGLQLTWVAPTVTYVELGLEAGNGDAFPGTRRARDGANAFAALVHAGGDVGDAGSWRAGLSWLRARAAARLYEDLDHLETPVTNAFTGTSRTWIADATFKWAPRGSAARGALELQAEYMRRTEGGELAFDVDGRALVDGFRSRTSGGYVQGVYRFVPRWRAGLRYDALDSGDPRIELVERGVLLPEDFPLLLPASPSRLSLLLDWSPSEFSRLRAQYAWDDSRDDGGRDRQLFLHYLYSIGAHGAHAF
jgi:uncharacterized small protein (DUF1192 family)